MQGSEQRPDNAPVELLADQGQVEQLDERGLQLMSDLLSLMGAEGRQMCATGGRSHRLPFNRGGWAHAIGCRSATRRFPNRGLAYVRGRTDAARRGKACETECDMARRRTKIVATLGPASESPEVLDRLLGVGVDCVRINCSHGTAEEQRSRALAARAAAARAGRPIGVLFDLQGPKLRLSSATAVRAVQPGDVVTFTGSDRPASVGFVIVDLPGFAELVMDRSQLVIGDGVPRLAVERVEDGCVVARALSSGSLSARKGVNVTYARPNLPAITDKDVADLSLAAETGADFVALSFVRGAPDVGDLRDRLRALGSPARTIAKIEKVEAYEQLDEILAVADGVMVARGDYGVEVGVARVPLMQKDTIYRATQVGKMVITATQMLESMIHASEPTRAEAADVANAVIDGTSAVMLSAETAVGQYPVEAVRAMAEIAQAAEESPVIHGRARTVDTNTAAAAVLYSAVQLAESLDASALVIPTVTGGGPRTCSKYRPDRPIIALVDDPLVCNQLMLEWGVHPIAMLGAESVDALVEASLLAARDLAGLPSGARVVLTTGRRTGTPTATSLIMVREIP
jgi:pyruvate kinase